MSSPPNVILHFGWQYLNGATFHLGSFLISCTWLNLCYRQIAREQGVDKSAVRHSVKSGKAAMRKYLKKFL